MRPELKDCKIIDGLLVEKESLKVYRKSGEYLGVLPKGALPVYSSDLIAMCKFKKDMIPEKVMSPIKEKLGIGKKK